MDELLVRLQEGDESAFSDIYKTYFPFMVYNAIQYLGSNNRAEDLVQEIFLTFLIKRTLHNLSLTKSSLKAYLRMSVKYKCKRHKDTLPPERMLFEEDDFKNEVVRKIHLPTLSFLSPKQQDAIEQIFIEGRERKEYALSSGRSVNTVNVQLMGAFKSIRKIYSIEDFVEVN